jgi:hypothetical protein
MFSISYFFDLGANFLAGFAIGSARMRVHVFSETISSKDSHNRHVKLILQVTAIQSLKRLNCNLKSSAQVI